LVFKLDLKYNKYNTNIRAERKSMFMRWKKGGGGGFYSISPPNRNSILSKIKSKLKPTPTPNVAKLNTTEEPHFENLDSFFYNNGDCNASDNSGTAYYLPTVGITNLKLCEPNELIFDQATIFFRILDAFKIPYALFAGSSIGLLRNQKTLPFVDDYDIIIFNKHVPLLINAAPVLKKHGFKIVQIIHPDTKQKTNGGCSIYSYVLQKHSYQKFQNDDNDNNNDAESIKKSYFLCDVFFSYFDSNGFLRNNASWGAYHGKNIHMKEVVPFQRHTFDGLSLPFFKDVASEVYKCYGNIEQCIIKTHALNVSAVYRSWKMAYAEFERIKQTAKENTMRFIFNDEGSEEECENRNATAAMNILDNAFSENSLDVLRDIHENKTKTIYSFSMEFIIRHAACIKYYFPAVQIEYFSYSRDNQLVMFLNYVDVLHVYNDTVRNFYNDARIMYLKKPRIDTITAVTFGTFFEDGKDFSILSECAKYSENIWVGLSSAPSDSFDARLNSIRRHCPLVKKIWKHDKQNKSGTVAQMSGVNLMIMKAVERAQCAQHAKEEECAVDGSTNCCIVRIMSKCSNKCCNSKSVHFS